MACDNPCAKSLAILKDTAKEMNLSEASTAKLEQYFKDVYEAAKKKGECPKGKTEECQKKFEEESVKACQALVADNEKELVAKVVKAAIVEINKCAADKKC